jgi:hypothetical protein
VRACARQEARDDLPAMWISAWASCTSCPGSPKAASCPLQERLRLSDIQGCPCNTMPALSQLLSSLEKKGYDAREIARGDSRRVAVSLTSARHRDSYAHKRVYEPHLPRTNDRIGEETKAAHCAPGSNMRTILDGMKRESRNPIRMGRGTNLRKC